MNGGEVYVNGPTSSGNGALDYDGEFKITGGILVGVGSNAMYQGVSSSSTQNALDVGFTQNRLYRR